MLTRGTYFLTRGQAYFLTRGTWTSGEDKSYILTPAGLGQDPDQLEEVALNSKEKKRHKAFLANILLNHALADALSVAMRVAGVATKKLPIHDDLVQLANDFRHRSRPAASPLLRKEEVDKVAGAVVALVFRYQLPLLLAIWVQL